MKNHLSSLILLFFVVFSVNIVVQELMGATALPLHTNSRWIVNEDGTRVKLACVNWVSHDQTVLAQGLHKSPLDEISKRIVATGFNCVRFTWPLALATDDSLASTTVENWFKSFGLQEAIHGIRVYNPDFLGYTLIKAFRAVVSNLGENNVMVILDNHISRPIWCCGKDDGNGFFGDRYFDPQVWQKGLARMALMFRHTRNVVGISIRNELRGARQNVDGWYKYMQAGAETVNRANPHVLVIISGLYFDNDLSFLKWRPLNVSFTQKLVYEVHRFGVSIGHGWAIGIPNQVCRSFTDAFKRTAAFLLARGFPLFLSEFGGDQRGISVNDNRFLNCVFGVIAELDLDWALWTLEGSYYARGNVMDLEEVWGVLNKDWTGVRNATFMQRVYSVQVPYQGPGLFGDVTPYNIVYHSSSGSCIVYNVRFGQLRLGLCEESDAWIYDASQKTIMMSGTNRCLQAVGVGKPISLGYDCSSSTAKWEMISDSKLQLSAKLSNGEMVCMDIDNYVNGLVITSWCSCLRGGAKCDPGKQWFKIIKSGRQLDPNMKTRVRLI